MKSRSWMRASFAPVVMGTIVTLAGCGSAPAPKPMTPPSAQEPGEHPEAHHHRARHHGGVIVLIAMSLKELELSPEQKATAEKIRAEVDAKMSAPHAAGKELGATLTEGVMAGAVDRAKADAAIDKLVAAVETLHAQTLDAINQLHATLTPAQRASLVDKLHARAAKWHESHGDDEHGEHGDHKQTPSHVAGFGRDLGLTDDQKEKIRSNLHDTMKDGPPHDHRDMQEHLDSFSAAFKTDTFDAKTFDAAGRRAATHMARWGATRMARFCEAAAPVLTPEQRTKLATSLRGAGGGSPS